LRQHFGGHQAGGSGADDGGAISGIWKHERVYSRKTAVMPGLVPGIHVWVYVRS
jgi:hypothetical protein